jgi:uncharacterized protein (DUF305 family)
VTDDAATPSSPGRGNHLRTALMAVIAAGLLVLGGGLAVLLGVGAGDAAQPGTVDVGFSRDMATHHLQGVEMANLVADRSEDPAVRGLAFDIASTQANQVGRMQGWLSLWGYSPTGGDVMAWMDMGSDAHSGHTAAGGLMPGMATEEELTELRSMQGRAFDVDFLQLMLRHHEGGLEMAEYGAAHADIPAVRALAKSIATSQTGESDLITSMLEDRGAEPLPAP